MFHNISGYISLLITKNVILFKKSLTSFISISLENLIRSPKFVVELNNVSYQMV